MPSTIRTPSRSRPEGGGQARPGPARPSASPQEPMGPTSGGLRRLGSMSQTPRPPGPRTRLLEPDLLRCGAMLAVLGVHANAWMGHAGGAVAAQLALLFAVLPRGPRASLVLLAIAAPLQLGLAIARSVGWMPPGPLAAVFDHHAQWFAVWWVGYLALGSVAAWSDGPLLRVLRAHRRAVVLAASVVAALAVADMTRAGVSGYDAFFRPSAFPLSVAAVAALAA